MPRDRILKPPNRVTVLVVRARDLKPTLSSPPDPINPINPIVTLRYDDEEKRTKRTTVQNHTLDPAFKEKFTFDRVLSTASKNRLTLTVSNGGGDGGGGDGFMGRVDIPLSSLGDRKERREWFSLHPLSNSSSATDLGSLLLAVIWSYDANSKPPSRGPSELDALNSLVPIPKRATNVPIPKLGAMRKKKAFKIKPPQPTLLGTYGNWEEFSTPDDGVNPVEIYFFNKATMVSTWDVPGYVKEQKNKLLVDKVAFYAERSLRNCGDSAYHLFRAIMVDKRERAVRYLTGKATDELHRRNMEKFFAFMMNADLKELGAAFQTWKSMVRSMEQHEEESAAVEIQRCVRSFVERRRQATSACQATSARGIQVHYIRMRVQEFSRAIKAKEEAIAAGSGDIPLVGELAMTRAEGEVLDEVYAAMEEIAVDEIVEEMSIYERANKERAKQEAFDDALDAAFESEDEADEENWETVEVSRMVEDLETGEEVEVVEMVRQRKVKEKRMSAMEMAIARRKQVDLVAQGLADPDTLIRPLNEQDIALAAERIEDNIVTAALDSVIEEVETHLNAAFALPERYKEMVWNDCIRLWRNDESLTALDVDMKKIHAVRNAELARLAKEKAKRYREEVSDDDDDDDDDAKKEERVGGSPKPERSGRGFARGDEEAEDDTDDDEDDAKEFDSDGDEIEPEDMDGFDPGFGNDGLAAIADAMRSNTFLRKLVVRNQSVGDAGVENFTKMMSESGNTALKTFDAARNHICNEGACIIAKWLFRNDTCLVVDLRNNHIGDVGTRKLMLALRKNERVQKRKIRLKGNRVNVSDTFLRREVKLKLGYSKVRTRLPKALITVKMLSIN